ncbi:hypothetical protein EYF80_012008 [Liparis tanakae]|uniref:Uncharacterized protein n=1 Tax=Liparis tanakae TaxID=230148 RepID=A0A4Z2IIA2_9TELE|nr:hypothetical protein EYF80_012008 [Liparis tanakae]
MPVAALTDLLSVPAQAELVLELGFKVLEVLGLATHLLLFGLQLPLTALQSVPPNLLPSLLVLGLGRRSIILCVIADSVQSICFSHCTGGKDIQLLHQLRNEYILQDKTRHQGSSSQKGPKVGNGANKQGQSALKDMRSDIRGFCGRRGRHSARPGAEQPDRHAGGPGLLQVHDLGLAAAEVNLQLLTRLWRERSAVSIQRAPGLLLEEGVGPLESLVLSGQLAEAKLRLFTGKTL